MDLPDLRDRVCQRLAERLPDGVTVNGQYSPVLELQPGGCAVVVQPLSLMMAFADRTRREYEPKLSVTVSMPLGADRDAVGDAVLRQAALIIRELHGVSFGPFVCRGVELADPILSETSLNQQNTATTQLILTFYGQEERKRD